MIKKKSQLSSFDIMVLVEELDSILNGGFIDKVYQPEKDELLIRISVPNQSIFGSKQTDDRLELEELTESPAESRYNQLILVIKLGKYLFVESKEKNGEIIASNPGTASSMKVPGPFAMLLRKHLRNAKITKIYQHEFDRIIIIEAGKLEPYQLVIEMFGDGNVILVKDNRIIQPLFPHTWRARALRAGEEYKPPPARINPLMVEKEKFVEILSSSTKDLVRTLIMDIDIPGKFAEEVCMKADLDKNIKPSQRSYDELVKVFEHTQSLFRAVETEAKAYLVYEDESMLEPFELLPIKLEIFKEYYFKEMEDYNTGVWQFFKSSLEIKEKLLAFEELQKKAVKLDQTTTEELRLKRQLEQQKEAMGKFSVYVKTKHEFGETIYTNYQRCEELLSEIKELRTKLEPDEIFENLTNTDDIKELHPHKGYVIIRLKKLDQTGEVEVKLSLRKSVIENANVYYEQSKNAKEKLAGAEKAYNKTKLKLENLAKEITMIEKIEVPKTKPMVGRHFWFEKYHWMLTSLGNLVVAGRDAKSNDQVVKKYLNDKDRYCHADISGAPSVVVKADPDVEEIPNETLHEACEFALIFSKAWHSKLGSGTAYWVKPDQVSKTPQSGEYLARGAFVIRGKRNYVPNIKLELALGEIDYQGRRKLMAGPLKAVKSKSDRYVVLVPGDVKKNEMAKELSDLFNVVVDDVLSVLPSGEFAVVQKVGFK